MAGIKISELSKWSINEIDNIDTNEILLPVSIGSTTGAMRASTLIEILSTMAPEHYMSVITENVNELSASLNNLKTQVNNLTSNIESQINSLQSSIESTENELNSKYNEIVEDLENFKTSQTEINNNLSSNIETIVNSLNDIISHNNEQDNEINNLRSIHDLPPYNQIEPEEPGTQEEPNNEGN